MIRDADTDVLYLSDQLRQMEKYKEWFPYFESVLKENNIPFEYVFGTKDIWCRDYMPIQISHSDFVLFKYDSDYLKGKKYDHVRTIQEDIQFAKDWKIKKSDLIIDGGNIISNTDHIIITDMVMIDNPGWGKEEIIKELKNKLGDKRITILPRIPYDVTGHADGMVKFIDEKRLLLSDYSDQSASYIKKLKKSLEQTGLELLELPSFFDEEQNDKGDYKARGCYINFVQIGDKILFPQFEHSKDEDALEKCEHYFPNCKVIPVNSNPIAEYGGVLNCMTWEKM